MRAKIIELIKNQGYQHIDGLYLKKINNRNIWIEFNYGEIEIKNDTIKIRVRTENRYLFKNVLADIEATIKFIEGIEYRMNKFKEIEQLEQFLLNREWEVFSGDNGRKITPMHVVTYRNRYNNKDDTHDTILICLFDKRDYLLKADSFKIEDIDKIKHTITKYEELAYYGRGIE